jgi:hypothetical protein
VLVPQIAVLEERNEQRRKAVERLDAAYDAHCQGKATALRLAAMTYAPDRAAYYKLGWQVDLPEDDADFSRTSELGDSLAKTLQAAGVEIDAGFRGFSRRTGSRCRKPVSLTFSEQAAAGTLVLHHPVLLAATNVLDSVADALAVAAAGAQRNDSN